MVDCISYNGVSHGSPNIIKAFSRLFQEKARKGFGQDTRRANNTSFFTFWLKKVVLLLLSGQTASNPPFWCLDYTSSNILPKIDEFARDRDCVPGKGMLHRRGPILFSPLGQISEKAASGQISWQPDGQIFWPKNYPNNKDSLKRFTLPSFTL